MDEAVGFHLSDMFSWKTLVKILNEPRDGSLLAFTRIAFGEIS